MTAEPKPLASLSAGLLARKGAARPAMRRQVSLGGMHGAHGHDDLGWNDMGYDVDPQGAGHDHGSTSAGLTPMPQLQADPTHDDVDDAVRDAISHAVDEVVTPIAADHAIPTVVETPPVVAAQQRLAREMALPPVEDMDEAVTESVAEAAPAVSPASPPASPEVTTARTQPVQPVPAAKAKPARRVQAGARGAYAFTLRLDPDRHLRLRLATATGNRSAQQILVRLLDDFLADQPEITAFASRLAAGK